MKYPMYAFILMIAIFYQSADAQDANFTTGESAFIVLSPQISDDEVTIEWSSAREINVRYFVLERSTDGINYSAVHVEQAKNRYPIITRYKFCDREMQLFPGTTIYYRVKMVNMNGSFSTSKLTVEKDGQGLVSSR